MIAYIGLVYGYLVDVLILKEKMYAIELVGILLILVMNIILMLY